MSSMETRAVELPLAGEEDHKTHHEPDGQPDVGAEELGKLCSDRPCTVDMDYISYVWGFNKLPKHMNVFSERGKFSHQVEHLAPEQETSYAGEVILPPM